ncbi:hypothetical protein AK812_SmicGene20583 [Symbiodinium microadriaticum]|uniref:Uncharacterized protein n=1 Tax=Symbiodinium microadriaticum TaxID=2951 RepID=A0A1Q9DPQ1_SYMMI|nr:hypothetical protein AK812_SmicGene20583 [Symbiodinium microadriaticum]
MVTAPCQRREQHLTGAVAFARFLGEQQLSDLGKFTFCTCGLMASPGLMLGEGPRHRSSTDLATSMEKEPPYLQKSKEANPGQLWRPDSEVLSSTENLIVSLMELHHRELLGKFQAQEAMWWFFMVASGVMAVHDDQCADPAAISCPLLGYVMLEATRRLVLLAGPTVVDVSATLPMEQQAWSCPVQGCRAGLGELPPQDRKRAIKKHIADAHPGETLRSLANLARKGGKNEGVSKNLQRIHATVRKKTFKTHDVVRIVPHERKERCQRGDLRLGGPLWIWTKLLVVIMTLKVPGDGGAFRLPLCHFVEESRQLLPLNVTWIGGGDFNDVPAEAHLSLTFVEEEVDELTQACYELALNYACRSVSQEVHDEAAQPCKGLFSPALDVTEATGPALAEYLASAAGLWRMQRTYVDDRSWASDTCYEALAAPSIGVGTKTGRIFKRLFMTSEKALSSLMPPWLRQEDRYEALRQDNLVAPSGDGSSTSDGLLHILKDNHDKTVTRVDTVNANIVAKVESVLGFSRDAHALLVRIKDKFDELSKDTSNN